MIRKGRKEYYRSLKLRRKNKERSFYFVLMRLLVLSQVKKRFQKESGLGDHERRFLVELKAIKCSLMAHVLLVIL